MAVYTVLFTPSRWSALLANAANPKASPTVPIAFISILKELSPDEARFLDILYGNVKALLLNERARAGSVIELPERLGIGDRDVLFRLFQSMRTPATEDSVIHGEFARSLNNLMRLELVGRRANATLTRKLHIPTTFSDATTANIAAIGIVRDIIQNFNALAQAPDQFFLTTLGFQFVEACQPPKASAPV